MLSLFLAIYEINDKYNIYVLKQDIFINNMTVWNKQDITSVMV